MTTLFVCFLFSGFSFGKICAKRGGKPYKLVQGIKNNVKKMNHLKIRK